MCSMQIYGKLSQNYQGSAKDSQRGRCFDLFSEFQGDRSSPFYFLSQLKIRSQSASKNKVSHYADP